MTSKFDRFDFGYALTTSASAIETFAGDEYNAKKGEAQGGCNRKWWFQKVHKMPSAGKAVFDFGHALHAVCERWLLADDTGRGPDGQPVDPFPKGWGLEISVADAALIRTLFQKAVESGMLRRSPGRKIEAPFQIEIEDDVSIIGFLDVQLPKGVEDHKTTSNMKYAKSRAALRQSVQMLIYGCVVAREWIIQGGTLEDLGGVDLRHNVFLKDFDHPLVRPTGTEVSIDDLAAFWDAVVVPAAKKMLYWKRAGIPVTDWAKVDGPKRRGVCKKYGGCEFQGVCGGTETTDEYRQRIARSTAQTPTTEAQMGSIFDKLEKKTEEEAIASEEMIGEKVDKEAAETFGAAIAEAVGDFAADVSDLDLPPVAPWAYDKCRACGGTGIASKGTPCTPCTVYQSKQTPPGPKAAGFQLLAEEGAILISNSKVLVARIPITGEVVAKENTAPEKKAVLGGGDGEVNKAGKKESVKPTKEKTKSTKRGRPRRGFTLLYGVVKRGKENVLDLDLILHQYGQELAEDLGASGYWALDAFKRRELLAMKAEVIAETFGPAIVVVTNNTPDITALAAALEPYAADVFVGLNR